MECDAATTEAALLHVLKKALIEHLRTHRPIRRSRHATAKADLRGRIPDTVSISERPASVEDRAVPGHWEGDLLCGSVNSYMVTLVERQTRYVMLAKIPSRHTHTVVKALSSKPNSSPRTRCDDCTACGCVMSRCTSEFRFGD